MPKDACPVCGATMKRDKRRVVRVMSRGGTLNKWWLRGRQPRPRTSVRVYPKYCPDCRARHLSAPFEWLYRRRPDEQPATGPLRVPPPSMQDMRTVRHRANQSKDRR